MGIKTLIIEDERLVARHLAQLLEEEGYQVCAIVSDGETAIKKIIECYPELILMDIRIKGEIDGIEVAEHIRLLYDIPIIYLTAFSDAETLQRAEMTNPSGYLIKPFRREQLLSTIRIALANHQAKRTQAVRKIDENQLEKTTESYRLKSVIAYIQKNLHHNINLELLSGSMGMTPAYFCRFFHKEIGCSPYQYIIHKRIEKAKTLLLTDRQLSISDIAIQCGFTSHSQLDRHFRKIMGITPKEYRS
jgi:YesN/AraC family two-component response regulator